MNSSLPKILKFRNDVTSSRLRALFIYDPVTGYFTRLVRAGHAKAGVVAGSVHKETGYRHINIDGYPYCAHRLAFLYMTGEWPISIVDHKDRNKDNNRWDNLRNATNSQNSANSSVSKSMSGYKGVILYKRTGRYAARIRCNGIQIHLGYFSTPEEAHEAYKVGAKKHFGEFGRAWAVANPLQP